MRGYTPVIAALYALPAGLAQLVTANVGKRLAARHGIRVVLTAGLAASAGGLLILSASGVSMLPLLAEAGLALLGAGIGSAINDLDRELGGAFGVGLLGSLTLAQASPPDRSPAASGEGARPVLG